MDKFKTIDLSKSGWNFRLTICPKGTLVKVEMKEFNQKDDKYKEVKTSWSGKNLTINDIEDVLDDAIKASRPDGMKPARSKGKFFDDLNTIKEQLFDAPDEIKGAFNNLTKYFSGKGAGIKHHYAVSSPTSNGSIKWEIMEISGDTPPFSSSKQRPGFRFVKLD